MSKDFSGIWIPEDRPSGQETTSNPNPSLITKMGPDFRFNKISETSSQEGIISGSKSSVKARMYNLDTKSNSRIQSIKTDLNPDPGAGKNPDLQDGETNYILS